MSTMTGLVDYFLLALLYISRTNVAVSLSQAHAYETKFDFRPREFARAIVFSFVPRGAGTKISHVAIKALYCLRLPREHFA
jgi:hypothetical protein